MTTPNANAQTFTLNDMQRLIAEMYTAKDEARGTAGTFMWLMEEVGELAAALREEDPDRDEPSDALSSEFADVLAWLATIANVARVDLQAAFLKKYGTGCPGCGRMTCECSIAEKP